ncbi:MAG: electron transport complex subunit RsxC, partial [Gammaproteobacteria bacterium]|nr:electron transport complex subunit RsxC [Gammaproteobacteria bacterium]
VAAGDQVRAGQAVAAADGYVSAVLHAPAAGRVEGVVEYPLVHPDAVTGPCLVLAVDPAGPRVTAQGISNFEQQDPDVLRERIERAGIIGLGGAGFPTHVKLREGMHHRIELLIINGVECEPFISCDDRLLRERADEVVTGSRIIARALGAERCIVAVEDDMPAAHAALAGPCAAADIELVRLPAVYPAGGEKQLIQALTGREVPSGGLPIHVDTIVNNVATAAAVKRAVCDGEALTSRVVTVTGEVPVPGNREVMFGTPVAALLEAAGFEPAGHRVLVGGPMMGVEIHDFSAPVAKSTNCILVQKDVPLPAEQPCIRCGDCVTVCPVGLQPQQLLAAAQRADFDAAQDAHLFDCIECGCCAYVCPSAIPLVHYYRYAKSSIEHLDDEHARAEAARERYVQHNLRMARSADAEAETGLVVDAPQDEAARQQDIDAAVARSRARRNESH